MIRWIASGYLDLTPYERIKRRYLRISEQHTYNESYWCLTKERPSTRHLCEYKLRYRIDIHIKGLYRWYFNKPLNFGSELRKVNAALRDLNGIDSSKFAEIKKKQKFEL